MDTFTTGSMIRFGRDTFKKRSWFFIGVTLLIAILSGIASALGSSMGHSALGQGLGSLVNFVFGTFIGMGVTAFFLKAHDSVETVESNALWHPQPFLIFLATKLLSGAVVILGLILLIVPGIMLALMFMFAPYVVIDKGLGPVEAMRESKRITDGHKWSLLGFCIVLGLLNILGAICLLVGLLVTIPITSLAIVHAYRTLSAHPHPHVA